MLLIVMTGLNDVSAGEILMCKHDDMGSDPQHPQKKRHRSMRMTIIPAEV